jgi:hypothetical protein
MIRSGPGSLPLLLDIGAPPALKGKAFQEAPRPVPQARPAGA